LSLIHLSHTKAAGRVALPLLALSAPRCPRPVLCRSCRARRRSQQAMERSPMYRCVKPLPLSKHDPLLGGQLAGHACSFLPFTASPPREFAREPAHRSRGWPPRPLPPECRTDDSTANAGSEPLPLSRAIRMSSATRERACDGSRIDLLPVRASEARFTGR